MSDIGVMIDQGASDWQIYQQGPGGVADVRVSGRWAGYDKAVGMAVRLVHEDTNLPVTARLDWAAGRFHRDGTWSAVLKDVPAGGLYRLETCLRMSDSPGFEGTPRGDTRHFLGVGDVWIIAGQSNASGTGRGPVYDPPELGVHLFNNAMRWTLASQPLNDATDIAHPDTRDTGAGHAPWLQWAKLVKQAVGHPIGLIQVSLGNTALVSWNPSEPPHPHAAKVARERGTGSGHELFDVMMQAVAAADGRVRGILWYQGCYDAGCGQGWAATHERRFVAAVRAWRKALGNPGLAVLTVQLNRVVGIAPNQEPLNRDWSLLREAQRRVPKRLKGVTVSPAMDVPQSDSIHNSPYGNLIVAQRVAMAALGGVYGRPVSYLAPEPTAARRIRGGQGIEIRFANVSSRLGLSSGSAIPFRVEDRGGMVGVRKVEYGKGAIVRLELARRLQGPAVVHGAYGADPPPVPYDVVRMMPMLGFHGLKVE